MLWYESFDKLRPQRLRVLCEEAMSRHTTFRVGGPARRMAFPETESELAALLDLAVRAGYPYTVIGNGSNLLAPDQGLDRLVINTSRVDTVTVVGTAIHALAGATLARIANAAQRAGLTGLEFAHGIPGTLGGAVFMNAGAYGGEMRQVVQSVRAWFPGEGIMTLTGAECGFGYRHSIFSEKPGVVLFVELGLTAGDSAAISQCRPQNSSGCSLYHTRMSSPASKRSRSVSNAACAPRTQRSASAHLSAAFHARHRRRSVARRFSQKSSRAIFPTLRARSKQKTSAALPPRGTACSQARRARASASRRRRSSSGSDRPEPSLWVAIKPKAPPRYLPSP